jgi:large subunit ribosomal protein L5e
VVRLTNTQVICQIVYATLAGDKVLVQANSNELKRYGLTVGLKNYPAAYCAGLLVGRRVLQKLKLDGMYSGIGNDAEDEATGEIAKVEMDKRTYFVDEVKDKRPFRCFLDIGLARTSVGAKIFGALKGAADAGLDIPHNEKNFPGYDRDEKKYDAEMHRGFIYGEAVKVGATSILGEDDARADARDRRSKSN